jgi:hypothetical protein
MSGLTTDNLLAVAVVWATIMLPSAAFGGEVAHPVGAFGACHVLEVPDMGQRAADAAGGGA